MSDSQERVQRAVRRRVRKVKTSDTDSLGSIESRPDVGPQRPDRPSETVGPGQNDPNIIWAFMMLALVASGIFISSGDTEDQWYDNERTEWHLPISLITILWIGVTFFLSYSGSFVYNSMSGGRRHYANLLFAISLIMSLVWSVAFSARNLDLAFMSLLIGIASVIGWWYLTRSVSHLSAAIAYIVLGVYLLFLTKDLLDRRES